MSVHNIHQRRDQLSQWVISVLSGDGSLWADGSSWGDASPGKKEAASGMPLKAIGGDAGFRRYYRVESPLGTRVAVDAPPETEDTRTFVRIARSWRAGGVPVPEVFAVDYEQGFMLQEDLGDTPLLSVLSEKGLAEKALSRGADRYQNVLDVLLDIQKQSSEGLPPYDDQLIQFELSLYPDWFLKELMGFDKELEDLRAELSRLFIPLSEAMTRQPQGVVHRDYHSRNLMLQPGGTVGVIDFQGALRGPLLYDVASLLKDCYINWPGEQVELWLMAFMKRHPVLADYDPQQLKTWFDLTGLQRHLKCLGIFSRLWFRDGKAGYLGDIPRTFDYVVSVCLRYPQFQAHGQWLETVVRPRLQERLSAVVKGVEGARV